MINLRPRQLCSDGFVTLGPPEEEPEWKKCKAKNFKKIKNLIFSKNFNFLPSGYVKNDMFP